MKKITPRKIWLYCIGLFILTFGQRLFVLADFGAGSFDAFCVGLSMRTGLSAGGWVAVCSVVMLLLSGVLEKRIPSLLILATSFVFGVFFDFWGSVFSLLPPELLTTLPRIIYYCVGLAAAPLGTAIYFFSEISKSAYDEMVVAFVVALRIPIGPAKCLLEVIMLLLALFIGGPVGITTVITAFLFGTLLERWMDLISDRRSRTMVRKSKTSDEP